LAKILKKNQENLEIICSISPSSFQLHHHLAKVIFDTKLGWVVSIFMQILSGEAILQKAAHFLAANP